MAGEEIRLFSGVVSGMVFWDCRGEEEEERLGEEADIRSVFGGSDLFSGCFQILNRGWKYLRGCGRMGRRKRKN